MPPTNIDSRDCMRYRCSIPPTKRYPLRNYLKRRLIIKRTRELKTNNKNPFPFSRAYTSRDDLLLPSHSEPREAHPLLPRQVRSACESRLDRERSTTCRRFPTIGSCRFFSLWPSQCSACSGSRSELTRLALVRKIVTRRKVGSESWLAYLRLLKLYFFGSHIYFVGVNVYFNIQIRIEIYVLCII